MANKPYNFGFPRLTASIVALFFHCAFAAQHEFPQERGASTPFSKSCQFIPQSELALSVSQLCPAKLSLGQLGLAEPSFANLSLSFAKPKLCNAVVYRCPRLQSTLPSILPSILPPTLPSLLGGGGDAGCGWRGLRYALAALCRVTLHSRAVGANPPNPPARGPTHATTHSKGDVVVLCVGGDGCCGPHFGSDGGDGGVGGNAGGASGGGRHGWF